MKKLLSISILGILILIPSCKSSSTTPTPVKPPTINSFNVSPSSIWQGDMATLSWSVSNADSVSIDQGIGSVALSGNKSISPDRDTTYTLTAKGTGGSRNASTSIAVKFNLSGSWAGTSYSNELGTSQITFSLTQTGPSVSGSWTVRNGSHYNSGNITGTVSGSAFSGTMTASGGYRATVSGTISNFGRKLDGTGTDSHTWTFSATKQ